MTTEITVPVISLWQPWASAIVTPHPKAPERGIKEYETRSWSTKLRGRILIHASRKVVIIDPLSQLGECADKLMLARGSAKLPFGAIVGSVEVVDIITSKHFHADGPKLSRSPVSEFHWGDWSEGRFGWKLANPVAFDEAIPYKGQQGFWRLPLLAIPEKYRNDFLVKNDLWKP